MRLHLAEDRKVALAVEEILAQMLLAARPAVMPHAQVALEQDAVAVGHGKAAAVDRLTQPGVGQLRAEA